MLDIQLDSKKAIVQQIKLLSDLLTPEYVVIARLNKPYAGLFFRLSGATRVRIKNTNEYGYAYRDPAATLHTLWLLAAWLRTDPVDTVDSIPGVSLCVNKRWVEE